MKNIRKFIPEGVLPSRKKLKEMSKSVDNLLQLEDIKDKTVEKVKRKVTEAHWAEVIKRIHSAVCVNKKEKNEK